MSLQGYLILQEGDVIQYVHRYEENFAACTLLLKPRQPKLFERIMRLFRVKA